MTKLLSIQWSRLPVWRFAAIQWLVVWTVVGALFALQLRWYYELPWPIAVFWGFADWYLWGILSLAVYSMAYFLRSRHWSATRRILVYVLSAPIVAAVHVVLTMIVAGVEELPAEMSWIGYFQGLYAKKIMLNLLTFGVLVGVSERITASKEHSEQSFSAKLGYERRLVKASEIIWAEVCGNHVNLHIDEGVWPIQYTLTELVQHLPDRKFLRINRSQLINLDHIAKTRSAEGRLEVIMVNQTTLTVSRRFQPSVRQAIQAWSEQR